MQCTCAALSADDKTPFTLLFDLSMQHCSAQPQSSWDNASAKQEQEEGEEAPSGSRPATMHPPAMPHRPSRPIRQLPDPDESEPHSSV